MSTPNNSDTYSVLEAATKLGIAENTLRRAIAEGNAPVKPIVIGRSQRIPKAPLDALLAGEAATA